jgi:N-acetylmuramoyl-L-alanine amidase
MRRQLPLLTFVVAAAAACAAAPAPSAPAPPAEAAAAAPELPPVPTVDGALRVDLVYPPEGATVTARDSTFVFGSTGSGRTQLRINGTQVPVAPNGAFLGFLPVPTDGVYRLEATKGGESASAERTVRVSAPAAAASGAQIVAGSAYPTGALALPVGETIEVGFRGTAGGTAWLRLPSGERILLAEAQPASELTEAANFQRSADDGRPALRIVRYRGLLTVKDRIVGADSGTVIGARTGGAILDPRKGGAASRIAVDEAAVFELVVGAATVTQPLRLHLEPLDPASPRVGVAVPPANSPSDWQLRGRNAINGPFHYFWPPGTRLHVTGERNGTFRVRLGANLAAWVPASDVRLLAQGTPPPRGGVAAARMTPRAEFIDLRIPLPERMPFHVDEEERVLHVSVFGATSEINFFQYGGLDPLIERAGWSQPATDVFRITVALTEPVWGYDTFFDAGGALIVRIRRPPPIDAARPLSGLLVALDPGHPPGGAIGPTRLTEAEANLWIAQMLRPMLEAAGARVLMTRTDGSAVDLALRPRMAKDSNAHVLVSVHNNAFPDGVNPFENNGTSVYYFHPHSVDMAKIFQRELLQELGLRDIGVGRADLALVRPAWLPAVLTETSFLMVPQQEAALRDPQVQERIARAHLRALEAFLRKRAEARM